MIDSNNTGITGLLCVGCSVTNTDNAISPSSSDYASITLTATLGATGSLAVRDALTTYPAGTLAGFHIANPNLVGANLLSGITLKTYLNGVLRDTASNATLVAAPSSLLAGGDVRLVGFVSNQSFDTIKIEVTNSLGVLSETRVYDAVLEKFCAGPALQCNTETAINHPVYPTIIDASKTGINGVVCVGCGVTNPDNVISPSTTDYGSISLTATLGASGTLAVRDAVTTYPAGTLAGFHIANPNLIGANLLSGITLKTYLNGTLRETSSTGGLIATPSALLAGSGQQLVGFVTTQSFDTVQIEVTNTLGVLSETRVYDAILEKFCAGPALQCNTETMLDKVQYPTVVDANRTGINGLICVACSVNNSDNVITPDNSDYGSIILAATLGSTGTIAIRDAVTTYPAGTLAGFHISNPSLLNANVLSGISLKTYLNGVLQETAANAALVAVPTSLLTGAARQRVTFLTTKPFDTIQIEVTNTLSALSETRVYDAILQKFCKGPDLVCNTETMLNMPTYPVLIDADRTGINGIGCVGCAVNNPENVITADNNDYGSISVTANVGSTGSIAVRDALTVYPAGTLAGFHFSNASLLNVNVLSAINLKTYLNGVLQESTSNGNLLGLSSVLLGNGRQKLAFITSKPFDTVQIEVLNTVGVLQETRVYDVILEKFCAGPTPACGETTAITLPIFPAFLSAIQSQLVGVGNGILNAENVVDSDPNNFAELLLNLGVLAERSIAVRDTTTVYAAGSFAGFQVSNSTVLSVDLLASAKVSTYLGGVLQETGAGNLLNLKLLSNGRQLVGFITSKAFDEIRFVVSNLLNIDLGVTRIYNASIQPPTTGTDNSGSGGICPSTQDFGDAPISYGNASHNIITGFGIGTLVDAESRSLNAFYGKTDGTGDDTTGQADEDGLASPIMIDQNASTYSLTVSVRNLASSNAKLIGWIDFNQNGSFDSNEAASSAVPIGANSVSLNFSGFGALSVGSTYARLRLSTDTTLTNNSPTGSMLDGEVEDHIVQIRSAQARISGRVFRDNGGNTQLTSAAYNGLQDSGESGIAGSKIELTDCNSNILASSQTDAAGDYEFFINKSSLPSPQFCIQQDNLDGDVSVSGSNGYNRTTDRISRSNNNADQYNGNNFGDAKLLLALTSNGQKTIRAGDSADYAHMLTASAVLQPSFVLQGNSSPNSDSAWQRTLYADQNCNGQIDPDDSLLSEPQPLMYANEKRCVVLRVSSPANASSGGQDVANLSASYSATVQDGGTLSGNSNPNTDTTLVGSATGGLVMLKEVRVVSGRPSSASDNTAFSVRNEAKNGQFLEYQITYRNTGLKNISQLTVKDALPTYFGFKNAYCANTPSDVNCTLEQQPDASSDLLRWKITGTLHPQEMGNVRFCGQVASAY